MDRLFILFFLSFSALYGNWAGKMLENLSLEEKIGQLFIIPVSSYYE